MKAYKIIYTVLPASELCCTRVFAAVVATVVAADAAAAMQKEIQYIIEERERCGYICNYNGTEIAVCRYDGNLCETYTDFEVKELNSSD